MAIQDQASEILRRLREGTDEIYVRYEKLIGASDAGYDQKIRDLDRSYYEAANQVAARAQIDLKNTLEKMADHGYLQSGETVRAHLSANASRNAALSALAVQKARDKAGYETQKAAAALTLSAKAGEETSSLKTSLMQAYQEQLNRDREFEAAQKKTQAELSLARQKAEQEAKKTASSSTKKEDDGLTPTKNVYDYLDDIVKKNTKYYPKEQYHVIDRTGVYRALYNILTDNKVSYRYRYELYLYGKSMGYIPEK